MGGTPHPYEVARGDRAHCESRPLVQLAQQRVALRRVEQLDPSPVAPKFDRDCAERAPPR